MNFENSNCIHKKINNMKFITTAIEYSLALLIIVNCNSVFERSFNFDYNFAELIIIFSILLLICLIFDLGINKEIFNRFLVFLGIFWAYIIIFGLINVSYSLLWSYIVRFMIFIPCMILCLCLYRSKKEPFSFFYKLSNIIFFIAIISLIMWLFCSVLKIISPNINFVIDWGKIRLINGYWNIYFETQNITFFSYTGLRNTSIFTEAPMFSLCLTISLLIETFLRDNIKKYRIIILFIVTITSFSTTGLVCCILILLLRFSFTERRNTKVLLVIKTLMIFIAIMFTVIIICTILIDKSSTSSYSTRLDDYIAGFKAWIDKPIFGNGYGSDLAIQNYMSSFRTDNLGFSNSIMCVLAQSGIWLFMVYIIPFILYMKSYKQEKRLNLVIVGGIIFALFCTTIFQDRFILLLFLSLGYSIIFIKN